MTIKNVSESVLRQLVSSEELCNSLHMSVVARSSQDGVEYLIRLELTGKLFCFESTYYSIYDNRFRSLLLDLCCTLADTILDKNPF